MHDNDDCRINCWSPGSRLKMVNTRSNKLPSLEEEEKVGVQVDLTTAVKCDEKFDPNSEVDAEMSEAMEELRMAKLFDNKEGYQDSVTSTAYYDSDNNTDMEESEDEESEEEKGIQRIPMKIIGRGYSGRGGYGGRGGQGRGSGDRRHRESRGVKKALSSATILARMTAWKETESVAKVAVKVQRIPMARLVAIARKPPAKLRQIPWIRLGTTSTTTPTTKVRTMLRASLVTRITAKVRTMPRVRLASTTTAKVRTIPSHSYGSHTCILGLDSLLLEYHSSTASCNHVCSASMPS
jgi:hypothetical protein